ncbi:unnamed protein product [Brachionus calyciflorus]|uniref:Uncharacterized protein n=1 Tax=Brachionus calyciflorus TaxID=104777 RepID=A0A813ZWW5_9BILA|nr:unnamed protein product [Brachionus calyciflorus]
MLGGQAMALASLMEKGIIEKPKKKPEAIDVSLLNPIRLVAETVRVVTNSFYDKDVGIWIGKRGLGNFPFSLTTSVGYDILHMAVMIDGIVYNLHPYGSKSNGKRIRIEISTDANLKSQFEWRCYRKSSDRIIKSKSQLENYAKSFEDDYYTLISDDGYNCQTFCMQMIKYATGESNNEINQQYCIAIGTIIA